MYILMSNIKNIK